MKLSSLQDLLVLQLKDLYNAEQQLTRAMPKMLDKATSPQLKEAISKHIGETEQHVQRLQQVFQLLGVKGDGQKCLAMEGLIRETAEFMTHDADPAVMDAGLIADAQRIEHYEIAGYGTACTYAKSLGLTEVLHLLQQILDEEKTTDTTLTVIAETSVNLKAENH